MPTRLRTRNARMCALRVEGHVALENAVAAVRIGQKAFDPAVAPLHRTSGFARRVKDRAIFGIGLRLHPETAADVVGQHADLRQRHLEHALGQQLAHHRNALRGRDQRVALRFFVPQTDSGTRLERYRRKPRIVEPHALDMRSSREGRVDRGDVSVAPVQRDVARHIVVKPRRVFGHRAFDVWKRIPVHRSRPGPASAASCACRKRFRDDKRHGFADEANAVDRQHRHRRRDHRLAVTPDRTGNGRNSAKSVGREICARDHRDHTGHRTRARRVDASDTRMSDRRADEDTIGLARDIHIVGELAAPREQWLVLAAQGAEIAAEAYRCS